MVFFPNVRRAAKVAAVAGVLAMALASCAQSPGANEDPDGGGEPQTGGTLVAASMTEMRGFDPLRAHSLGAGIGRAAQVMDTLMFRDDVSGEAKPRLAESLESDDGQTWVLTLREGINFTDGTPLDGEAVKFNLDRHIAPESTSTAKSMLDGVVSIEVTDELEVTITLDAPSGSFPLSLTGSSAASLIGSPTALADPEEFNINPVGAGPFKFVSWTRDSELKLERNEDYWMEGHPYVDELVYRVLPDTRARVDALLANDTMVGAVDGSNWASVEGNPGLTLIPSTVGGQAVIPNAAQGPGSDERVRQAIGMAIDPKVANTIIFPGSNAWDGNRDCLPFPQGAASCLEGASPETDVEKATDLIAEYAAEGGDTSIDFVVITASDEVTFYQQQMSAIGLDVNLRVLDAGAWLEDMATGNYDVIYGIIASAGYPTQWRYMYSGGTNWGQVQYDDYDDALLRARDALKLEDRNAAWQEVAEIQRDRSIFFWQAPYTTAIGHSDKLHLGSEEFPYTGTLMMYFADAWMEQ